MGLIESWQQNRERIAEEVGGSVTKVRERSLLVDGATKVVCYIAEFHPDNYNQATPFFRALIDSTCRAKGEAGLPPVPLPGFTGGQCDDVAYGVEYRPLISSTNNDFSPLTASGNPRVASFISSLTGPVTSYEIEDPGGVIRTTAYLKANGRRFTDSWRWRFYHAGSPNPVTYTSRNDWGIDVLGFVRSDGLADDCGNPSADERPPTQPVPEAEKQFNVTYDNDTMVFDLDLSAPIENRLVFINNDFNLVVDLDGFKTETEPEKPVIADDPGGKTTKFAPEDLDETPVLTDGEEVEEENEEVEFVTVTVTTLPDSGRTYLSENANDIHMNAAYLRWMGTGEGTAFSYPDIAIRRVKTVHKRPDEAGAYRVYAVNGAKISVSTYTEKEGEGE